MYSINANALLKEIFIFNQSPFQYNRFIIQSLIQNISL
jgi:hypothetical protein